jgi:hypothetical protein
MAPRIILAVLLMELGCALLKGQIVPVEDPTRTATVCEILSQPLQYDGKVVRIRSRQAGTDEGLWLSGDECPGILATGQHIWPSEIWVQLPSSPFHLHPIDFQFDAQSQRRVEAKYRELTARAPDRCIVWTYTGLFETRRNWSEARAVYANGTSKFVGFGHQGEAPGQIIIKSADDVSVVPNCDGKQGQKSR